MTHSTDTVKHPLGFDPLSSEFLDDPYKFYQELRSNAGLPRAPGGFLLASRYDDVAQILSDRRLRKEWMGRIGRRTDPQVLNEPAFRASAFLMLSHEPPEHTRLRGLVAKAFTARRVEEMRSRIQRIVDNIIDQIEPDGHAELISDFAFQLPITAICEMLGIPENDRDEYIFRPFSQGLARMLDPISLTRAEIDQLNKDSSAWTGYFTRLFELRRRSPRDDLTTSLVEAEEQGDKLSEDELVANVMLLFGAGYETTTHLIGNGILALYRNVDQLELLRKHPELTKNAVEEFLRYDAPQQVAGRVALEDVQIGATTVKKGEAVLTFLGAANHDSEKYRDADKLDVTRQNIRPLSFGGGIHTCLGAQLARLEAEIAINTLLHRLPNLKVNNLEKPQWRQSFVLRGLSKLEACW